jgi:2-keto-4-pentenoate hydratase/2-oxohepta-3-ene-1,7-dioic acid hydratase in catechol pathway
MKLATFSTPGTPARIGLVVADGIVDLSLHLRHAPVDMIGLILQWKKFRPQLEFIVTNQKADLTLDAANFMAPIRRPGKILGIGFNYVDHHAATGIAKPDTQLWSEKLHGAINPPFGQVRLPGTASALDAEAELAFVIGKRCRRVSRTQAADVIFGYCAASDFNVPQWQQHAAQLRGPTSCTMSMPFGPWIVTAEELENPHDLGIRCFVNGQKRQDSNTRDLIFDCFDQVVHLSQTMTLEPGDVVMTGTAGGIGARFRPPRWLKAGDVVEVEIERIGSIQNTVVRAAN